MAKKVSKKTVETLKHTDDKRKNIPTAEYQAVMTEDDRNPIQVAYERRNRDLDPQLVWRGKDHQDWSDLVVQAPPLFIQEKVHPKVLIDDLQQRTKETEAENGDGAGTQADLFADFNGLPSPDAQTDFYQHDANWSNRMILGDSLQVMTSLAEREGLRGKVQCIYIDPPYGIKFNSNFQWSTTSRDVKDGNADHITREPEQVKAFRDTWRDGIHSYLTYLRDRLTVARDLLTESGSIFVQIGDENVHRVRALMDEVFGEENFITQVSFATTSAHSALHLSNTVDYILMFAKQKDSLKYRHLYGLKLIGSDKSDKYTSLLMSDGSQRSLTSKERTGDSQIPSGARIYTLGDLVSRGWSEVGSATINNEGRRYECPSNSHWKTSYSGLLGLGYAGRLVGTGKRLMFRRFLNDFAAVPFNNQWMDTSSGFSLTDPKVYVVQTRTLIIQRCILMATDPGDLVLDPTCGSGTTAYVAEQWGRRWITIDTSRVALALARARVMGARYPFYLLDDSRVGQIKEAALTGRVPSEAPTYNDIRQGFVYERVPHITLRSIANNAEINVIWERWQEALEPLLEQLDVVMSEEWKVDSRKTHRSSLPTNHSLAEWEVPRDLPDDWPPEATPLHKEFWTARVARQREIDASIAAKADYEYLYDKPYQDKKKVRVAGPFTVESLSPHRLLGVDENDELIDRADDRARNVAEARLGFLACITSLLMSHLNSS